MQGALKISFGQIGFSKIFTKGKSVRYLIIFSVQNKVSLEMRKTCQKNEQFGG